MTTNLALSLKDIQFRWPNTSQPCLDIPRWEVELGQRLFLYGPSGSGKSTLLNIIAGILSPEYGRLNILTQDFCRLNQRQRDRFRAQHMGVIFQQFNLVPYLSLMDNISLSQKFSGKPEDIPRRERLLKHLSLDTIPLQQKASELSVGQQQRVAVARALYHQPEIIIADEPTSSLDEENRNSFIEILLQQVEQTQSTLIFVSHDKTLSHHFDQSIHFQDLLRC